VFGVLRKPSEGQISTTIGKIHEVMGEHLWDVEEFVSGVFGG
jgi:hypothetical protein